MMTHSEPSPSTWELTLDVGSESDTAWRTRLLEVARPALEAQVHQSPEKREFRLPVGPFTIQATRRSEAGADPSRIRLVCSPTMPVLTLPARTRAENGDVTVQLLPDPALDLLGRDLIGLETIADPILHRLSCAWDGKASDWSKEVKTPLPPAFARHLTQTVAGFVFEGSPGTGKSSLAKVIGQRYVKEVGCTGQILILRASVRGGGKVGEFSQRLQAAGDLLRGIPEDELGLLLVDEAEAVGMARSEAQSHHEDKAGTACLLQILDSLAGLPRTMVVMTTNLLESLDAALRRRCTVFTFPRPNFAARRTLLARWLPAIEASMLDKAAEASDGMTPADLEQTLAQAYLGAIADRVPLRSERLLTVLRDQPRTRSV